MLDINLIDEVKDIKSLLKKYDEYLYLDITRKYFNKNKIKIKEIQTEINNLNKIDDINEKIVGVMQKILIKFDAVDLYKKYF